MAAYEQPFDNPPTYVESTSRPGRPARPPPSGAQPANVAAGSSQPFVTSGGWIPPAGTWQSASPSNAAGYGAPAVPPLPPRQPNGGGASTSRNGHDRDDSSDDDASSSHRASSSSRYPEEKRSSGLFGSFGKRKEKAPLPESSSSSDEASSSSFWRGSNRNASSTQSQSAGITGKHDKGKSRQAKEPELAPSSRFIDSSEEALRGYLARIPADAQKALAPLGIVGDAKSVEGIYSVELSTHTKWIPAANGQGTTVNPTCSFTANARNDVDVTLYLRPNEQQRQQDQLLQQQNAQQGKPALPARTHGGIPLEILLRAAKGRIRFSLPEKLPDRPLRIICTLESHVSVQLPMQFNGKVAIWAPAGNIELSGPLKRNSTIVPSSTGNAQMTVYRIMPEGETELSSSQRNAVMDLCQLNTTKGRVKVEYARPLRGGGQGECIVC